MNYNSVAQELVGDQVADVQFSFGARYTVQLEDKPGKKEINQVVAEMLRVFDQHEIGLKLDDKANGMKVRGSIGQIADFLSTNELSGAIEDQIKSLDANSSASKFREQLWGHLVARYEFLRADSKRNFERVQEFLNTLMESLCSHYQDSFLRDEDSDGDFMEFPKYLNSTLESFTAFSCSSPQTEQGYFQKRCYGLKEKLASQEKELASVLRVSGETNLEQLVKIIKSQYTILGGSVSSTLKEVEAMRGFDDKKKIKDGLDALQTSLKALYESLGNAEKAEKTVEKKKQGARYFLPFHRISTRQTGDWRQNSKRSISLQNSKYLYSEHMSYDSDSQQNMSSSSLKREDANYNNEAKGQVTHLSDKLNNNEELIGDEQNDAYTVNELSAEELIELERLRAVLAEFGVTREEVVEGADTFRNKIDHFLSLEDKYNMLSLKYLKLSGEVDELRTGCIDREPTQASPQKEVVENLRIALQETEAKKKMLYDDLVDEKKKSDHLSHQCDQLQNHINKLSEAIDKKEAALQGALYKYQELLSAVETRLMPKISQYRMEFDELNALLLDGYIRNLMLTYKDLNIKKADVSYTKIDFLQEQYEQFATAIEMTARNERKQSKERMSLENKLTKLMQLTALLEVSSSQKLTEDVGEKVGRLNAKVANALNGAAAEIKELSKIREALEDEISQKNVEIDQMSSRSEALIKDLELRHQEKMNQLVEKLESQVQELEELSRRFEETADQAKSQNEADRKTIEEMQINRESSSRELISLNLILTNTRIEAENLQNEISSLQLKLADSEDDHEKMKIMNTKLIGELDILSKRHNAVKLENEELVKKIHEHEDLVERTKGLELSNRILQNKLELSETYKHANGGSENDKAEGESPDLKTNKQDKKLNLGAENESDKESNCTIHEVDEKDERSDVEPSIEFNKLRHLPSLPMTGRESDFNSVKGETERMSSVFTMIKSNYSYLQRKEEVSMFGSPSPKSGRKVIFSKESIMKNIEAYRQPSQSRQEISEKKNLSQVSLTPLVKSKTMNSVRLDMVVQGFMDRIEKLLPVEKMESLEDKLKKLEFVLLENDIQSLSRPKRDSNLQALTVQSNISRDQSYLLDKSRSESKHSFNMVTSMLQKKQGGLDTGEKPKDESRKLFDKKPEKKPNVKLDKLTKTYGNTSQTKKFQTKFTKQTIFKQPKLLPKSIKPPKKETKSVEIDFEQTNKVQELAVQRIRDELQAECDALRIENVNLISEMESIAEQNKEYRELLERTFQNASLLVQDRVADNVLMKFDYVDQIIDIIKTKIENYESTINELDQEIEVFKNDAYVMQQERLLQQTDLADSQEEEPQDDMENPEKKKMLSKALEELLTNMFAIAESNIGYIQNLEEQIIGDHNAEFSETQKAEIVNIALELDKLKSNTINIKEMIECLYDNLMELIEDTEEGRGDAKGKSGSPLANLQSENEYLYQQLENLDQKYQALKEKYRGVKRN